MKEDPIQLAAFLAPQEDIPAVVQGHSCRKHPDILLGRGLPRREIYKVRKVTQTTYQLDITL